MREVEGMSYDEMAQAMNVSKGTIMSRLFHARQKLQRALADCYREVCGEHAPGVSTGPEADGDSLPGLSHGPSPRRTQGSDDEGSP